MKKLYALALATGLALAASALAQTSGGDPLTGTWVGDWGPSSSDRNQVTVELKFDGKKTVTGTVNPGANAVALTKSTYDPATKAVHLEADAKGHGGGMVHYLIDGKVDGGTMTGTWKHDPVNGDFKITKKS